MNLSPTRILLMSLTFCLVLAAGCSPSPRPQLNLGSATDRQTPLEQPELIIKFSDADTLSWNTQGDLLSIEASVDSLLSAFTNGGVYPVYPRFIQRYRAAVSRPNSPGDTKPAPTGSAHRLVRYYSVFAQSPRDAWRLGQELSMEPSIERVYPRPRIVHSAIGRDAECVCRGVTWAGDREFQRYLRSTSISGIESDYALESFGADGSIGSGDAVDVMVIDTFLNAEHRELITEIDFAFDPSVPETIDQHGTHVIGMLAAMPQDGDLEHKGFRGIVSSARFHFGPAVRPDEEHPCFIERGIDDIRLIDGDFSLDCALDHASEALDVGDVLLIPMADATYYGCAATILDEDDLLGTEEYATEITEEYLVPVNASAHYRDMLVNIAESRSVAVVLSAGNAGLNLNLTRYPPYLGSGYGSDGCSFALEDSEDALYPWSIDTASPHGLDETSILVGAGVAVGERADGRDEDSNFGDRVDCQGWGDSAATLGFKQWISSCDESGYRDCWNYEFGETSAAATMVAGVVAAIQGALQTVGEDALTPGELRAVLADPINGTPQGFWDAESHPIGPRPDLKNLLASPSFPSDLYTRDSLDDSVLGSASPGTPRLRATDFESPDLVLMPIDLMIIADAVRLDPLYYSRPSYVFETGEAEAALIRIQNRGLFPGRGRVHLYRTPATPIAPPDAWGHVGVAEFPWVGPESLSHSVASVELSTSPRFEDTSWVMVTLPWDSEATKLEIETLGTAIADYQQTQDSIRFLNREQLLLAPMTDEAKSHLSGTLKLRIHDFASTTTDQALEIQHDLPAGSSLEILADGNQIHVDLDAGTISPIAGTSSTIPWSGTPSLVAGTTVRISDFLLSASDFIDWSIEVLVPSDPVVAPAYTILFDQLLGSGSSETRVGRMAYIIWTSPPDPS